MNSTARKVLHGFGTTLMVGSWIFALAAAVLFAWTATHPNIGLPYVEAREVLTIAVIGAWAGSWAGTSMRRTAKSGKF